MSEVRIHTQSPIHPSEDDGRGLKSNSISSPTKLEPSPRKSTLDQASKPSATQGRGSIDQSQPAAEPGARPVPQALGATPMVPPPKVGEKVMPSEFYSTPERSNGTVAPTASASHSSYEANKGPHAAGGFNRGPVERIQHPQKPSFSHASLEHPPGYTQNPHATDMTSDQALATQQSKKNEAGLPAPSGVSQDRYDSLKASGRFDEASEAWDSTKKWLSAKGAGAAEQLGDMHNRAWEAMEGKK